MRPIPTMGRLLIAAGAVAAITAALPARAETALVEGFRSAQFDMTEEQVKAKGIDYKVGKFPFTALGKAKAVGETEGLVKLIFDKKYGEILGGHIIGPEATEQIAEIVVARGAEATQTELHRTIHAHPTFSEAVMEAAAAADGEAIHI